MLFHGRPKLKGVFATSTALLLVLVVLVSGAFWTTERSAAAEDFARNLISNPQVRQQIADRILTQISDGADAKTKFVIQAQRSEIRNAIAAQLGNPAISRELTNDVRIGYHFLASEQKSATIDLQPLLPSLLAIMSKIDPQFKDAIKLIKDIKPINLTKTDSTPDIGKWLTLLKEIFVGLIVLLLLSMLLLFRYAASATSALKILGIETFAVGAFAIILFFGGVIAATSVAHKATDPTAAAVIPIAARQILSYFRNLGLALAAVGFVTLLASAATARGEQRRRSA